MNCYHCGTPMIGEGAEQHCPKCTVTTMATSTTILPAATLEMVREELTEALGYLQDGVPPVSQAVLARGHIKHALTLLGVKP